MGHAGLMRTFAFLGLTDRHPGSGPEGALVIVIVKGQVSLGGPRPAPGPSARPWHGSLARALAWSEGTAWREGNAIPVQSDDLWP